MNTPLKLYLYLSLLLICCMQRVHAQNVHPSTDFYPGWIQWQSTSCVVPLPDGKFLIGGDFSQYNGTDIRGLCRVLPDGSLDTSFFGNSPCCTTPDVQKIAVQPDGKIIVVGNFDNWRGVTSKNIVRLNPNGRVDTSFHVGQGLEQFYNSVGFADIALQADGKILVTGWFYLYDGQSCQNIVRINPDGSRDDTYGALTLFGTGSPITSSAIQPDGKLIVGGWFDEYGPVPLHDIARLNTDGTVDTTFAAGLQIQGSINDVARQPDGKILVGGYLSDVNGVPHTGLTRLLPDGQPDTTFHVVNTLATSNGNPVSVDRIAVQGDGKILIGGTFNSIDNLVQQHVARLMPDGTTDFAFWSWITSQPPKDLVSLSDTSFMICGSSNSWPTSTKFYTCGSFSVTTESACGSYLWNANNNTYWESGRYIEQLPSSDGCDSITLLYLTIAPAFSGEQPICIVGVDSLTNRNRIVWEKVIDPRIDAFHILRETIVAGVYEEIGSTTPNDPGIFIDTIADPVVQPYRYKVSVLDSCGLESVGYAWHQTIHLMINPGINNAWNLIWTPYQGIDVPTYHIFRGTNAGNMTLLTSVSGNVFSFTDTNAPDSVYYQVGFVNPNECDPAKAMDYSESRSNVATNQLLGITANTALTFDLFPNPAEDQIAIHLPIAQGVITIRSAIGAVVARQQIGSMHETVTISSLSPGVYTLTVDSGNGSSTQRFVKR
jgi:uncharacterized delta-60 repeat protein